ncbi:MAG: DnaB-like helicase C-terminal domain-containing protein [Gallionella sp.]|jgi:replicative DNA helicase
MTDAILPNNQNAERALIGAILIGEEIKDIRLEAREFYTERHGWAWEAMQSIHARGETPDYVTVSAELRARDQLGKAGGDAWLISMINDCQSASNAQSYAAIVKTLARRRTIIRACGALAGVAYDQDSDVQAAVSKCIDQLSKQVIEIKGAVHIGEVLVELWDEIEAAQANPSDIYGIPTGFIDWDKITHGLQYASVVLLTGEPGIGKSLLAAQMVTNAAQAGYPMAYYSLEMSALQVARRTLSRLSKVSTHAMRSGRVRDDEWEGLVKAFETMQTLPIYISKDSEMSTMDLRVDLQRLKDQGVKGMVLDYEALLSDEGMSEIHTSTIRAERVHAIMKDLNMAGLVIGDMVKSGMGGGAQMTRGQAAAAGSGRSIHDRDEIMIMRTNGDDKRIVDITWEKLREGDGSRFMQLGRGEGYPAFTNLKKPDNQSAQQVKK